MLRSKNTLGLLIILVLLLIAGAVYFFYEKSDVIPPTPITSYEECVSAGFPSLESYPPQCITSTGEHFTQNVGNAQEKSDKIQITYPQPGGTVTSPLIVKGKARGTWYFEASFPVFVTDWDGKIIGEGHAEATSDWMTTEFVPYVATITFAVDPQVYSKRGTLILQKDNPSGMPENDDAVEIPVMFQ